MSYGGAAKCMRCNKSVYMADEVLAAGGKWHKICFKCKECNVSLSSNTVSENKGEVYCDKCHKKLFGIAGYGFGQGAGALATDSAGKAGWTSSRSSSGSSAMKFGGTEKCPRCGKSVYAAEKVVGAGSSWHKACFNCASCNKKLDSTTVSDKDGQIYCKGCYGKEFGPKGFGFGQGAGALTMTK